MNYKALDKYCREAMKSLESLRNLISRA